MESNVKNFKKSNQNVLFKAYKIGMKIRLKIPKEECMSKYGLSLDPEKDYTVKWIYPLGNTLELEEIPQECVLPYDIFEPTIKVFNVYKWKKHYILSDSINGAQNVWNTWIDILKIVAGDGKPKLFKKVNNLCNIQDDQLFPKQINGMKCEYPCQCILKDLEWEDNSVLFEL